MTAAVAVPLPRVRTKRLRWSVGMLAAPITVWLLFFFVAPFLVIVWYSFGRKPSLYLTHDNSVLSFDRYVEAISPAFLTTFGRTVQISVIGSILCLLIAFPMAYWMSVKLPAKYQGIAVGLVLVPYWTNFLVRTIGWQITLSPSGFVAGISRSLGLGTPQLLDTTGAVQLGVVYNYLPLMILPLYVTMERLDHRLLEASRDLGANALQTFRRVTLPLAMPGVAAGLLLVFVPLMGDYITPAVLGGAAGSMIGQQVASQFNVAQNWALGGAMAIILMIAILAIVLVVGAVFKIVGLIVDRFEHIQVLEDAA